jgi:hypothetical protein
MPAKTSLPVVQIQNLHEARFECTFGRGCEGLCCRNGRPGLVESEIELLNMHLPRVLPMLRPEARRHVERRGYLTRRRRAGLPLVAVVKGWCVFFNQGCVLHKLGAAEGDKYRYKPYQCVVFPLLQDDDGTWYVRQWGYKNEPWDLFCLHPDNTTVPAAESLREEIEYIARLQAEADSCEE